MFSGSEGVEGPLANVCDLVGEGRTCGTCAGSKRLLAAGKALTPRPQDVAQCFQKLAGAVTWALGREEVPLEMMMMIMMMMIAASLYRLHCVRCRHKAFPGEPQFFGFQSL